MNDAQWSFHFGNVTLSFSCKSVNDNNMKFDCPLHRKFSRVFGSLEIQLKFDPCQKFRIFSPFEISLLRNKPHRSLEDTLNSKICKKHHDLWHISALTNRWKSPGRPLIAVMKGDHHCWQNLNGLGWTIVKFRSTYWLKNNENQTKQWTWKTRGDLDGSFFAWTSVYHKISLFSQIKSSFRNVFRLLRGLNYSQLQPITVSLHILWHRCGYFL